MFRRLTTCPLSGNTKEATDPPCCSYDNNDCVRPDVYCVERMYAKGCPVVPMEWSTEGTVEPDFMACGSWA